MIDPNLLKQPKVKTVVGAKPSSDKVLMMPDSASQDSIRERAYQLYESRGRQSGQEQQDWFRAEQEVLKQQQ